MVKILSSATLVLMLILMPPATLMYASNNAVPGQTMYPVKRTLEQGILFLASFNPTTKAYFSISQTEQRFNEVESLINTGSDASDSLNELIGQTEQAAFDINSLSSAQKKYQLITELSDSIDHYQVSLQTVSQTDALINYQPSQPQPSPMTAYQHAAQKAAQPSPRVPSQTVQPSASPQVPQVQPPAQDNSQLAAILEAQKKLEEIKKQLEQQQNQLQKQLNLPKEAKPSPELSSPSPIMSPSPVVNKIQDSQSGSSPSVSSPSPEIVQQKSPIPTPSQYRQKSRKSNGSYGSNYSNDSDDSD